MKHSPMFQYFGQMAYNLFSLFFADTLGTEGGSSWASETTSPGSSCATPNSAVTEAPESELSFTVGATDVTPHLCRFCEKAFPRQSYLKKHEQVSFSSLFFSFSLKLPSTCFLFSLFFLHFIFILSFHQPSPML